MTDVWAAEIRDYLLGRLSTNAFNVALSAPTTHEFTSRPITRWWIFEGKRYGLLGGTLAAHFSDILSMSRRLEATFNPRLRPSDRPDGEVDWGQTLARGAYRPGAELIVRSSGIGLDEAERAALRGWLGWLEHEWQQYSKTIKVACSFSSGTLGGDIAPPFALERLRTWAHVARRSRWPLLREVVAESLRPVLEPEEVDHIPLPEDPAKLFELLCIVRIARHFVPSPRELRWLDRGATGNVLQFDGLSCRYQQPLERSRVLAADDYRGELARAVEAFDVGIPKYIDIAFDFELPVGGFHGLLVEAKSGTQQYRDAVAQLRTYRSARQRPLNSRYLVWGVVQGPIATEATRERVSALASSCSEGEDVWMFSSADAIDVVLTSLLPSNSCLWGRLSNW